VRNGCDRSEPSTADRRAATAVSLASSSITDREVAILQELPQLEELSLRDTENQRPWRGASVAMTTLRSSISVTRCSRFGAREAEGLTALQQLDLSHTPREARAGGAERVSRCDDINLSNTPLQGPGPDASGSADSLEKFRSVIPISRTKGSGNWRRWRS